jgi:hypothetical protein
MAFVTETTLLVDKGDKTVTYAEGKSVRKSDFDDKLWDSYIEDGSVREVSSSVADDDAEAKLQARVVELEAELAEARKTKVPAAVPPAK